MFIIFMIIYIVIFLGTFIYGGLYKKVKVYYLSVLPSLWMVQVVIFVLGTYFVREKINNSLFLFYSVSLVFLGVLSVQIFFFSLRFLIEAIKFLKDDRDFNKFKPRTRAILLIVSLIGFILAPSFIFGSFYNIWNNYSDLTAGPTFKLNMFDYIYFAFAINYSLPLSGDFELFQSFINVNYYLRIIQIIHVISTKLLEVIIISFIVSKIVQIFDGSNNKTLSFGDEILKLTKLRNQKQITNEEFQKFKKRL